MRLFLQCVFFAAVAGVVAFVGYNRWYDREEEFRPDAGSMWIQGLWPVFDKIVSEINSHSDVISSDSDRPVRVTLRIDTSKISAWQFAPLRVADLEWRLTSRQSVAQYPIVVLSPESAVQPDVAVNMTVDSYVRNAETDELAGRVRLEFPGESSLESDFRAVCPSYGREWFVTPSHRLPVWAAVLAGLVLLLSGAVGIWAARQTFSGKFDRSGLMNTGAFLVLTVCLVVGAADLVPAGYRWFGIPHRAVRIVLDVSDSVCYPAGDAVRPSLTESDSLTDLGRFVIACAARIGVTLNDESNAARAGLAAWLKKLWRNIRIESIRVGTAGAADGVRLFYDLPPLSETSNPEKGEPKKAQSGTMADLPKLFGGGCRGVPPGFFLPWSGLDGVRSSDLIVAFMTGEPASPRHAQWLADVGPNLRAERPRGLRVVSVLLPALPRSDLAGWSLPERLRNVAAISDYVLVSQAIGKDEVKLDNYPAEIEQIPVFPETSDWAESVEKFGGDLDIARAILLRADRGLIARTAEKISEQVRGMSDVRENSVFAIEPFVAVPVIIALAALLMFVRLQRELKALDMGCRHDRWDWLGAICGLMLGLALALLICFLTADPLQWRVAGSPALMLWSVALAWYAIVWLPLLLGRASGPLPAPATMLRVRHLSAWFTAALASAVLFVLLAYAAFFTPDGLWKAQKIVILGVWITAGLFAALALRYQWVCFWRPSRRRIWLLGMAGLAVLIVMPACVGVKTHSSHIWVTAAAIAVSLPGVGALTAGFSRNQPRNNPVAGLGWFGLIAGTLIGLLAVLLILQPISLAA